MSEAKPYYDGAYRAVNHPSGCWHVHFLAVVGRIADRAPRIARGALALQSR
jgi:hypothetical protein